MTKHSTHKWISKNHIAYHTHTHAHAHQFALIVFF